ncbi:hypothetical protein [Paenibacillus radicis (ex Xue et al. 2023)]|uniref:Uncharacterized protein n=1 Tax=Paenibacillus radicis (ex Xue et al. 2023) TaxID=2972489 RepID=A0ABT1YTY2_9BACL|nr:hypothetical protein [Paenibacillus radicis (ex Xue et al. 2023)]MCR8635445.1 hypothetical protein [Paenibacillus radicis (ex Xue et al. 2023)]
MMLTLSGFVGSAFKLMMESNLLHLLFYEVESEQQDEYRKVWVT